MTQFMKKSFSVPMSKRSSEKDKKTREGYVWKTTGPNENDGYWLKSSDLHLLGIPTECERCGKTETSNLDMQSLDAWSLCKECFIETIEGREESLIQTCLNMVVLVNEEDKVKTALAFLNKRGAHRWIKSNWPDKYDVIYGDETK